MSASKIGTALRNAAVVLKGLTVGVTLSLLVSIAVEEMTPETIAIPEAPAASGFDYANLSPDFFGESRLAAIDTRATTRAEARSGRQRLADAATR